MTYYSGDKVLIRGKKASIEGPAFLTDPLTLFRWYTSGFWIGNLEDGNLTIAHESEISPIPIEPFPPGTPVTIQTFDHNWAPGVINEVIQDGYYKILLENGDFMIAYKDLLSVANDPEPTFIIGA